MASAGAPRAYLVVNAGALLLGAAILSVDLPRLEHRGRLIAGALLLALFALPLLTGPTLDGPFTDGVRRWLPLGPLSLHAGMLAIPPLLVLASEEVRPGALAILAALVIAMLQPDFASAFALTGGAVGLYQARRDWRIGLVIIVGFLLSVSAALRGELPAVPFVERIVIEAIQQSIALGALLALALAGALLMMLFGTGLPRRMRYAIGMGFFGFLIASLISTYPTPLAGYGAAAIIGFALAHALAFAQADAHKVDA